MESVLSSHLPRVTVARTNAQVDALIAEARPTLFRLALAIMASRDRAEDVTQDALVRATKSRGSLAEAEQPMAWLRTTLIRCALTALKHRPNLFQPNEYAPDLTLNLSVAATLDRLEPADRTLLALAHFEEFTYAEIGETLGIPVGTVASRLHAARAAFRREWKA